ncbi:MAG TPA: TIGR00341 family protein [Erythrobacter sp.]|nr:TIGR00341 family protein [Erythrobacter sp.]
MSAQRIEIFLPESEIARLEQVVARHCRRFWRETVPGRSEKLTCLVQRRYTERLINDVEATFANEPSLMVIVSDIAASIPALAEDAASAMPVEDAPPPTALERWFSRDRLSTDELYDDLDESLRLQPNFLLTVVLSSLIAALGMNSGQTAVVIGAMVIAPLLGPTMALALAATLGDGRLGLNAAGTLGIGALLAIAAGALVGGLATIHPEVAELSNRTVVNAADIVLALACGTAGVLAFSRGGSLSLVGVMIAVALVPPLAACGIFLATADLARAGGAIHLFAINLVSVNVAGIGTFLIQGLPPKSWRMTAGVLLIWLALLLALASLLLGPFAFDMLGWAR